MLYRIDIGFLYGLRSIGERGLHDAATALREINRTMRKWVDPKAAFRSGPATKTNEIANTTSSDLTGHYPSLATAPVPEHWLTLGRNVFSRRIVDWLYRRAGAPQVRG